MSPNASTSKIKKVTDRFVINYLPVYLLEASDVVRYRTTSLFNDISDADWEKKKKGKNQSYRNGFTSINRK